MVKGEVTMKRGDGTLFPAEISSSIYHDSSGTARSLFARDMTEYKQITEQLTYQAYYDPLTDLPNRVLFMDRLTQRVQQARRDETRLFAVMFLDLDRFKYINDSLGHAAGDQLLTEIARRLKTCVRANDTVARLSGDEFTVLLDSIDHMISVTLVAARIRNAAPGAFLPGRARGLYHREPGRRHQRPPLHQRGRPAARRRYRHVPGQDRRQGALCHL